MSLSRGDRDDFPFLKSSHSCSRLLSSGGVRRLFLDFWRRSTSATAAVYGHPTHHSMIATYLTASVNTNTHHHKQNNSGRKSSKGQIKAKRCQQLKSYETRSSCRSLGSREAQTPHSKPVNRISANSQMPMSSAASATSMYASSALIFCSACAGIFWQQTHC